VPIVVCSVLPDRDLAVSLGANDFLAKPITRAALLEVLERVFTA
jgi:FixJ family two-component response regulator